MSLLDQEKQVKQAVATLNRLLSDLPQVEEFQKTAAQVRQNEKIAQMEEAIKAAQKEVVAMEHYDKPEAKKIALQKVTDLTAAYDEMPLVISYRQQLLQVNDLLQYVTQRLQQGVEKILEKD